MRIIVDADACPATIKDLLYKTSSRLQVELVQVANQWMRTPVSPLIHHVVVSQGADEADNHIVEIMEPGDLIITADIPLADRVIKKNGVVLDPRGTFLTTANIGTRLAMRDLMDNMRSEGVDTGGPGAYGQKEKQAFANHLDRFLTQHFQSHI